MYNKQTILRLKACFHYGLIVRPLCYSIWVVAIVGEGRSLELRFFWALDSRVDSYSDRVDSYRRLLETFWGIVLRRSLWRVLVAIVVLLLEFRRFLRWLWLSTRRVVGGIDDCYCCARWRYFISSIIVLLFCCLLISIVVWNSVCLA